ncbi:MAG: PPC domain-containing protein [Planctomycetales bacterium]|nr:PPC domain-containing protein [Planctomycetales bacterium]
MRFVTGCALLALTLAANAALAQQTNNSYPMLMSLKPVAIQIGQTTECEVAARYNLFGANKVLVSGSGVTGEVVPPEKPPEAKPPAKPVLAKIKLKFTVASDAQPRPREFRIATPQGVRTIGQIVVVSDTILSETADNDTAAKSQVITLPATACGTIEKAEDVDWFKFKIEAGTTWTFRVRGQRLENAIHDLQTHVDPIISLRNSNGSTLAQSDNVDAGDPLLSYKFDQAGDYLLEIRDVRYLGNADWVYAIEMHNRPHISQVFPISVAAGAETKLAPVGLNLPAADAIVSLTLPSETSVGLQRVAVPVTGQPTNDFAVVVSTVPPVLEAAGDNNTIAAAPQAVTLPAAINGRIESASDIDVYSFEAAAGDKWSFEVFARRAGSELDPVVRLLNDKGAVLIENDDGRWGRLNHADSWIENWAVPAAGKYFLEIRDLHLRGGPGFTYLIQATKAQPYFELEVDTDKTQLAPGANSPVYVRVVRKNGFVGEVTLGVEALPPGVTATTGRILESGLDGVVILQAAANATAVVANIRFTGAAILPQPDGAALSLTSAGRTLQEMYNPGGGRVHWEVGSHTVSVADPMDLRSVKISTADIKLAPGSSQKIEVTVERAPDFKGNVTLEPLFTHLEQPFGNSLPKGVTVDVSQSKTLLTANESKGWITLKAAADAPAVERQLAPVMAHVSINFVMKATYCGEPLWITVAPAGK